MGVEGSITQADRDFVETWENISISWNSIIRIDRRGDEQQEVIQVPKRFFVTTEERLLMNDRVLDPANNPFLNGSFRPIVVPDSVTIESNPNALSDNEILSILVSSELAFDEWMRVIDSPATLTRMLEVAEASKDADISLRRYQRVQERLIEMKPKKQITQKDADEYENIGAPSSTSRSSAARGRPKRSA